MEGKWVFRVVLLVAVAVTALLGISEYASYRKALIEKEREQLIQEAETERTEERSQFWQKIVPWGNDEDEDSK